jgi:4-hydroxy-tetrahydrodipicolinate reductase
MKIGITGCAGRMGRMLIAEVATTDGAELAGGSEHMESPLVGRDVAELAGLEPAGLTVAPDAADVFAAADAVIDFTLPAATEEHARLAAEHGTALIIGTTGLAAEQQAALEAAAQKAPVVQAANFSLGVNLLAALTRQVASILDEAYDIEIVEMHHRHKVDAPSGTALALGRAAAEGRGVDLDEKADKVRDGFTGERKAGDIGFATLRGGDVVGDHTVIFAGAGERVEVTHKAASRVIFARGAVRAALWTNGKAPGLYGMKDVLGVG